MLPLAFHIDREVVTEEGGGVQVRGGDWGDGKGGCEWLSNSEKRALGVEKSGSINVVDCIINYIGSLSTIDLCGAPYNHGCTRVVTLPLLLLSWVRNMNPSL